MFGGLTCSIADGEGASFGGYMMDNVTERSCSAGQVACGVEHPEAVSVRVRGDCIECTRTILTGCQIGTARGRDWVSQTSS